MKQKTALACPDDPARKEQLRRFAVAASTFRNVVTAAVLMQATRPL